MRVERIAIGLFIWVAAAAGLGWLADRRLVAEGSLAADVVPALWSHATAPRQRLDLRMRRPLHVEVGDPIFVVENGAARPVGEIREVVGDAGKKTRGGQVRRATAVLYPGHHTAGEVRLAYHKAPRSLAWAVRTLLPAKKRRRIATVVSAAIERHHAEIAEALRPVVVRSVRDAFRVVERDLPRVLRRHRGALEKLGAKYERVLLKKKLLPLSRKRIWPVVRRHAAPVAREIGRELWKRASVWRFAWRAAYDRTPLPEWAPGPEKPTVPRAFERFIEREAAPVLRSHSDDFARVVRKVIEDLRADPAVVATAKEAFSTVLSDPAFHRVTRRIVRDLVVENPRFRKAMERHWTSADAKDAFRLAADRLEPTARKIGELLLGTPEKGITPEFERVLRSQLLRKDRRWFVLERRGSGPAEKTAPENKKVRVVRGTAPRVDPFIRGELSPSHGTP